MSVNRKDQAYIAGIFEHPTRHTPEISLVQLHAECALGALKDAGLSASDVDGFFGGRDIPGSNANWFIDYMNLKLKHIDSTDAGGCSPLIHIAHAVDAIASGKCNVALITLAGRPRSEQMKTGTAPRPGEPDRPDSPWEVAYRPTISTAYAMMMARHMHEYGTTAEQLAWIRVAASEHAKHNPLAMFNKPVTVQEVMNSPLVAPPLRRMDCCVISDGGGAIVLVSPAIARSLKNPLVRVIGTGHTVYGQHAGYGNMTTSGAAVSGPIAFKEAGVTAQDFKYASIYDNFTIMVLMQLEDLGFCKKGEGGKFVSDGKLISGQGPLAINTDGGGLCNNHPSNRGGITKVIEATRQLRGSAHPSVQVKNCDLAMACGPGGFIGTGYAHATVVLERV
jgi:acetyl-CoA C-acetyltransferase